MTEQLPKPVQALITDMVDKLSDRIRAKAADEAHAADVRALHEAGHHDAAEYLRGAR